MNSIKMIGRLAVCSGLLALVACSGGVSRQVDVGAGEYYSAEEFSKLSQEDRDAYCASLDAELATLQSSATSTRGEAGSLASQISGAQGELNSLRSDYEAKKGSVGAVQEEIDWYESLPKSHTVVNGEFLRKISAYENIYNDKTKWPRIYRANKDRINDPNLIYPGWELTIPRDWPSSWTVSKDEYLAKIAGYWEVYGDRSEWTRIHEANKSKIKDPDLIQPGWELAIPRGN